MAEYLVKNVEFAQEIGEVFALDLGSWMAVSFNDRHRFHVQIPVKQTGAALLLACEMTDAGDGTADMHITPYVGVMPGKTIAETEWRGKGWDVPRAIAAIDSLLNQLTPTDGKVH